MYINRESTIFSLDEVIATVLRNEIYSKTGRRRLGSLFPLYFSWSQLGFLKPARKEPVSAFFLRRQISNSNLSEVSSRFWIGL
jgi:hypothetical protein